MAIARNENYTQIAVPVQTLQQACNARSFFANHLKEQQFDMAER